MEESLRGTTSRFLVCLAPAGRRGTEAEEAQHEGRQPLPVLPKELGDASICAAAGEMEAALALLPLAGNGGPPLATDIADLQKAQQPSRQRCAAGPPGLPQTFGKGAGIWALLGPMLQIHLVDCGPCLC